MVKREGVNWITPSRKVDTTDCLKRLGTMVKVSKKKKKKTLLKEEGWCLRGKGIRKNTCP